MLQALSLTNSQLSSRCEKWESLQGLTENASGGPGAEGRCRGCTGQEDAGASNTQSTEAALNSPDIWLRTQKAHTLGGGNSSP